VRNDLKSEEKLNYPSPKPLLHDLCGSGFFKPCQEKNAGNRQIKMHNVRDEKSYKKWKSSQGGLRADYLKNKRLIFKKKKYTLLFSNL
jgi:hypothetical protein